jgi:hypothetical protein
MLDGGRAGAGGLLLLPDFIANAGDVICAAIEYRGGTEGAALALIAEEFRANTAEPCSTMCGAWRIATHGGSIPRHRAGAPGDANTAMGCNSGMNCTRSMSRRCL